MQNVKRFGLLFIVVFLARINHAILKLLLLFGFRIPRTFGAREFHA
jgi:hypothetical protein